MAKFSKQHYQAIASEFSYVRSLLHYPEDVQRAEFLDILARRLATEIFERDNSRFNREHFLAVVRGERAVNSRPPRS